MGNLPPDPDRCVPSTRKRKKVESLARAAEARSDEEQVLHYAPRDFVLCGLPYKRPSNPVVHERRNGSFVFRVEGVRFGVPFGQDRLIMFWLASAYRALGCPDDRIIRFRCAADIMRCYGIDPAGVQYVRLRERIERVFGATYFAFDESPGAGLSRELRAKYRAEDGDGFFRADSYRLIQGLRIWFQRRQRPNQYTLWDNTVTLTDQFARDIKDSGVPVDLQTVTALRDRPAALDLYVWQAWRSWRLAHGRRTGDVRIPLRGERGLLAQLGSQDKKERQVIAMVRAAQHLIRGAWPGCPNEMAGDTFIVRPGRAIKDARFLMPGVAKNPPTVRPMLDENREPGSGLLQLHRDHDHD